MRQILTRSYGANSTLYRRYVQQVSAVPQKYLQYTCNMAFVHSMCCVQIATRYFSHGPEVWEIATATTTATPNKWQRWMNCCCSRLRIQPMYSVMQAAPCSLLLHVQRFARVLWLILFISFHFALSLNAIICANNLLQMGNHYFFWQF